jgi:hypothetical protein
MNRKGVGFPLVQVEPGSWKRPFQIGEAVTTGKAPDTGARKELAWFRDCHE